jgi:hypothetical protein
MQQVSQYLAGERDYPKITGGTGPLVYPAAHVYIYTALYWITDKGNNIRLAQSIFAALYLFTLGGVMACYRKAKVRMSLPQRGGGLDEIWFLINVAGAALCLSDVDTFEAPA